MRITAIFESWHIADGNYPPLDRGQRVNLSFELIPDEVQVVKRPTSSSFVARGGADYDFSGSVLRVYEKSGEDPIAVIETGNFRFYINQKLSVTSGDHVQGRGSLFLDHYIWVEFLEHYLDAPDLFYQLQVERIQRVVIPEHFIVRHPHGKSLPTALATTEYGLEHVVEVETMSGQTFDEEFYLIDFSDEGVSGNVHRTFQ